jgi:hypothetical protein
LKMQVDERNLLFGFLTVQANFHLFSNRKIKVYLYTFRRRRSALYP